MLSRFRRWVPQAALAQKVITVAVVLAVGIGAFCLGRRGAISSVEAQTKAGPPLNQVGGTPNATTTDYSRRVVAYIYGNIPITREELGEYLIARFGAERLEFLINRKLVEMACASRNIHVTDGEVETQFRLDLRAFGPHMTEKDFVTQVLKRFNKSLYEWKEDVIRPKLMISKFVEPTIKVSDDELRNHFEAKFGPKVKCRMIALTKDDPHRFKVWEEAKKSREAFLECAGKQTMQALAATGGDVPPIHKHFGDPELERAAFSLKEGNVSSLIQMKDGTHVILMCEKHLAEDPSARFEEMRTKLITEVRDMKLAQRIPEVFAELRKQANPQLRLTTDVAHLNTQTGAPSVAPANGQVDFGPNTTMPAAAPAAPATPGLPAATQTGGAPNPPAQPLTPVPNTQTLPLSPVPGGGVPRQP